MNDTDRTPTDERDLRWFWILVGLASAATLVAALGGMVLGLADPEQGSTARSFYRGVAAGGGLAAGALFGLAAIWAQVRNLWRFAPMWFRYLAWGVLIVVAVVALISSSVGSD